MVRVRRDSSPGMNKRHCAWLCRHYSFIGAASEITITGRLSARNLEIVLAHFILASSRHPVSNNGLEWVSHGGLALVADHVIICSCKHWTFHGFSKRLYGLSCFCKPCTLYSILSCQNAWVPAVECNYNALPHVKLNSVHQHLFPLVGDPGTRL